MGIFSFLNPFKKKQSEEKTSSEYSSVVSSPSFGSTVSSPYLPAPSTMSESSATQENMKAKLDLMMTQIDSMRMQSQSMNERIIQIENMVKTLLEMSKR